MIETGRFPLPALLVLLVAVLGADAANAQDAVSFKNFTTFQNIVPGVDFFASNRQTITPYEAATAEAISKLKGLFDEDLPKGAIFICSNLAQKDSLYEPIVLRRGYKWVLISETPEVRMQEAMERIRARIGDNIPEEFRNRLSNPPQDMLANAESQAADAMARDIAYAVLQAMINGENFNYRSSRVGDVGKSPLPDWLDVSIAAHASNSRNAVRYMRNNMDQTFPIEDVITMSRPFVDSFTGQSGGGGAPDGGQVMIQMGGGGFPGGGQGMPQMNEGGSPGGGGMGQGRPKAKSGGNSGDGPPQRELSKAEQDQMLFDGQAITFFDFYLEKFGVGKMKELIQFVRQGKETLDYIVRPDVLGSNLTKIENDWTEWLNAQPMPPDPKPKPKSINSNNRNRG